MGEEQQSDVGMAKPGRVLEEEMSRGERENLVERAEEDVRESDIGPREIRYSEKVS